MGTAPDHPCLSCGACCANYRVSFYWAEADDATGGIVPAHLTDPVSPHLRPSTCREFDVFDADGNPNQRCAALRIGLGLAGVDFPL